MLKQFASWHTKRTINHAAQDVSKSRISDPSRCLIRLKVSERDYNHGQSQGVGGSRASNSHQSPAPQQYQALAPVSRSSGDAIRRAPNSDGPVIVTFWLTFQAEFGQRICIVGNCPGLGNWQHKAAPEMQWSDGHKWSVTVEVPPEHVVEYKYVVLQPDGLTALHWQQGNNAVLAILPGEVRLEVEDNWYDAAASAVIPSGGQRTTRSDRLALWAGQLSGSVGKLREELRATRMSVFEAQQGMRDALEQVQETQDTLSQQVELNDELADKMVSMQEKNRNMRLQLLESQTLFKEVMEEAREIILASVEAGSDENYTTDDDRSLLGIDTADAAADTDAEERHGGAAASDDEAAAQWDGASASDAEGAGAWSGDSGSDGELAPREREWWEEGGVDGDGDGARAESYAEAYAEGVSDGEAVWDYDAASAADEVAQGSVDEDWRASDASGAEDGSGSEEWRAAAGSASDEEPGAEDWRTAGAAAAEDASGEGDWRDAAADFAAAAESDGSDVEGQVVGSDGEYIVGEGNVGSYGEEVQERGWSEESVWGSADEHERSRSDGEASLSEEEVVSEGESGEEAVEEGGWRARLARMAQARNGGGDAELAAPRANAHDSAHEAAQQSSGGGGGRGDVRGDGEVGGGRGRAGGEEPGRARPQWDSATGAPRHERGGFEVESAAERLQVVGGPRLQRRPPQPVHYAGVDEEAVEVEARAEVAPAAVGRRNGGRRSVARPAAAARPEVTEVLQKVPAAEAAGALLEAQVRIEAGLDGESSGEDVQWLTEQAESLLSVFEQLESDVTEADQAIGRAMSTDA